MNTNFVGNLSWNKSKHFHLFLILMLKKPFFNVKLNLCMNNFFKHIFRSSRLQMFFKISALKNFAILRIKKRFQRRCFPVRSSHMVLTHWYIFLTYFFIFFLYTYHLLLSSCECCKVFKNSFFKEHVQKQSFEDVLQNRHS